MSRRIRFEPVSGDTLLKLHDKKTAPIDAIATPFPSWNAVCGEEGGKKGLAKGWVVIIGGVTGSGKSYLAGNLLAHAVNQGKRTGMINFEMSQMAVSTRYLSILTGIPKWKLEMGDYFSSEAWLKAKGIADSIQRDTGGVLIANESAVFDIEDIAESYRQLVDAGVEMIVVDYAQLVTVQGAAGIFQRSEAVAYELRELTHQHNVVTVAISQFNQEEAKRNKPPTIHGLMGGGVWSHAANQIWLLNHTIRQKYGLNDNGKPLGEYTEILGGKNRHGMDHIQIPVQWDYDTMRFDEYVPKKGDDHPFDMPGGGSVEVDSGRKYSEDTSDLFD